MKTETVFQLNVEFDPLELHGAVISIVLDSGPDSSLRKEAVSSIFSAKTF